MSPVLAPLRRADCVEQCPRSGATRKTFAHAGSFSLTLAVISQAENPEARPPCLLLDRHGFSTKTVRDIRQRELQKCDLGVGGRALCRQMAVRVDRCYAKPEPRLRSSKLSPARRKGGTWSRVGERPKCTPQHAAALQETADGASPITPVGHPTRLDNIVSSAVWLLFPRAGP